MIHSQVVPRIIALAALIVSRNVPAAAQSGTAAPPYVETVGFGQRRVAPDRATVLINVTTKAQTAAAAAAENARIQLRVMDTLRTMGLGTATSTGSYNIGRDYEPNDTGGRPRMVTAARTTLRVRLNEIRNIGQVIDATLARGATGVDGVSLEASTAEASRRAAMAEAAASARADADALARALGGALGPMISATSAGTTIPASRDMGEARMLESLESSGPAALIVPYAPSELVITARVVARWLFNTGK